MVTLYHLILCRLSVCDLMTEFSVQHAYVSKETCSLKALLHPGPVQNLVKPRFGLSRSKQRKYKVPINYLRLAKLDISIKEDPAKPPGLLSF
jgi:hypothetical protein